MMQLDSEVQYRDIPGFSGYRAGSDGTIWSCFTRGERDSKGRVTWVMSDNWKVVRDFSDARGRRRVEIRSDSGARVKRYVHVLVLTAFVGHRPDGMEACHFPDRNCSNCRLENLRWDTKKGNALDKIFHGTQARGVKQHLSRLNDHLVADIRKRTASGESYAAIAVELGVSETTVSHAAKGLTWSHVE